jgi:S-methylmethionine-dependent homocysteine/selenocysteine methylase
VARGHAAWAEAGATHHTTVTFRARPSTLGDRWQPVVARAVELARGAVPTTHRVWGSIGPIADCYRPSDAPAPAEVEGRQRVVARALAEAGVDGLLLEGQSIAEAPAATRAAVGLGRPVWVALTAGPSGDLASPEALADAADRCVAAGAERVLVHCVAATLTLPYVQALVARGAPVGVYANAARFGGPPVDAETYAEHAATWVRAGADVVGACCGCTPAHLRAVVQTTL